MVYGRQSLAMTDRRPQLHIFSDDFLRDVRRREWQRCAWVADCPDSLRGVVFTSLNRALIAYCQATGREVKKINVYSKQLCLNAEGTERFI